MFASRSHSTVIFISCRRGAALFHCKPQIQRCKFRQFGRVCNEEIIDTDSAWYISSLIICRTNLFHFRGYIEPDRFGLHIPVSAWLPFTTHTDHCFGSNPCRLLACVCFLYHSPRSEYACANRCSSGLGA